MNDMTRPSGRPAPQPGADTPDPDSPGLDSPDPDSPGRGAGEADPYAALDPGRAMRRALARDARADEPAATAEDTVLSWLLGLPGGVDPALAARQLMAAVEDGGAGPSRLGGLMSEIGRWPAARLARLGRRGRRAPG